jgi:hypothetical protein
MLSVVRDGGIMAIFCGHIWDSVSKGIQFILQRFAQREEKFQNLLKDN